MNINLPIPSFTQRYLVNLNQRLNQILRLLDSTKVNAVNGVAKIEIYTVATLPDATEYTGGLIFVSDEVGGATLAFSDGTNWLRVQDRVTVS